MVWASRGLAQCRLVLPKNRDRDGAIAFSGQFVHTTPDYDSTSAGLTTTTSSPRSASAGANFSA